MSPDSLTVGDLLLLRQLAGTAATGYIGDRAGAGERLDAVANARRRALAFVDPETLRQVQDLERHLREVGENEDDLAALLERQAELYALPCGAPPRKPDETPPAGA